MLFLLLKQMLNKTQEKENMLENNAIIRFERSSNYRYSGDDHTQIRRFIKLGEKRLIHNRSYTRRRRSELEPHKKLFDQRDPTRRNPEVYER